MELAHQETVNMRKIKVSGPDSDSLFEVTTLPFGGPGELVSMSSFFITLGGPSHLSQN